MSKSAISIRGPLIKTVVFAVVTSAILGLVSIEFGKFRFYDTTGFHADFTDATQLISGDPVMVSGVRVGQVNDVSLHHETDVRVAFDVRDVELPAATEAVVRYRNLTGDRYLELVPRGADSGEVLKPGSVIGKDRTRPALDLDVLLGGLQPLFDGLDDEQINRLSSELIAALQGEGGKVESILAQTASFSSTLAERDEVIGQTIDNLNSVLATLDTHSAELSETVIGLNTLATGLATDRERLGRSFDQVDQLTTSVGTLLQKVRGPFQGFVTEVGNVSQTINSQREQIDTILEKLPGYFQRIARLGARGPGYNLYLCRVRVRLTLGDGNDTFTPWVGPAPNNQRCTSGDVAPGETEEQLQKTLAAERGEEGE